VLVWLGAWAAAPAGFWCEALLARWSAVEVAEAPEAAGVLLFAISVNLDRDFEPAPPAMALFDEVFA
jgi:hypothetical protein